MVVQQDVIGGLVAEMRQPVQTYVSMLRDVMGENLRGVTLYGAIAAGLFDASKRSMQSVVVLEQVELAQLRRLAEQGRELGRNNIGAPLVMTPSYIQDSLDTFPLELIEISQNHLTVCGEDFFAGLEFKPDHVRLQCERELKVLSIGLRQGLLAAAGRERVLDRVAEGLAENVARVLRGVLWFKGTKTAKPALVALGAVEELIDRKLPGIRASFDPGASRDWQQFELLYGDVQAIQEAVDGW